jgi:hypothetical protein
MKDRMRNEWERKEHLRKNSKPGIIHLFALAYKDNGGRREFLREVGKIEYPETLVVCVCV